MITGVNVINLYLKKSVCFGFLVVFALLTIACSKADTKATTLAKAEVSQYLERALESSVGLNNVPTLELPQNIEKLSENEKLAYFLKINANFSLSANNQYKKELREIGFEGLFEPNRLKHDLKMRKSYEILDQSEQALNRYIESLGENGSKLELELDKLNLDEKTRKLIEMGIANARPKALSRLHEIAEFEHRILQEMRTSIKLLEIKSNWTVQNNQLIFKHVRNLNEFNQHMNKIDEYAGQANALSRQGINSIMKK